MFQRERRVQHNASAAKSTGDFAKSTHIYTTGARLFPLKPIQDRNVSSVIDQMYINQLASLPAISSTASHGISPPFTVLGLIKDGKFIPQTNNNAIEESAFQEQSQVIIPPISSIQYPSDVSSSKCVFSPQRLLSDKQQPAHFQGNCSQAKPLTSEKTYLENNNNQASLDTLRLLLTTDPDDNIILSAKPCQSFNSSQSNNTADIIATETTELGSLSTLETLLREAEVIISSSQPTISKDTQNQTSENGPYHKALSPPVCTSSIVVFDSDTQIKRPPKLTYSKKTLKDKAVPVSSCGSSPVTLLSLLNSADNISAQESLSASQPLDLTTKPLSKPQVFCKNVIRSTELNTSNLSQKSNEQKKLMVRCSLKSNRTGISIQSHAVTPNDLLVTPPQHGSLVNISGNMDMAFPVTFVPSLSSTAKTTVALEQNIVSSCAAGYKKGHGDKQNSQLNSKNGNRSRQPMLLAELLQSPKYQVNCLSKLLSVSSDHVQLQSPDGAIKTTHERLEDSHVLSMPGVKPKSIPQSQVSTKRKVKPPSKCVNPACCPSANNSSEKSSNTTSSNPQAIDKKPRTNRKPKTVQPDVNCTADTTEKSFKSKETNKRKNELTLADIMADYHQPIKVPKDRLEALERLSREAMKLATDGNRNKVEVENVINNLSGVIRSTFPNQQATSKRKLCPNEDDEDELLCKKGNMSPTTPQLSADNLRYIKELCPPDNQCPPSSHISDLRLIRPAIGEYLDPEVMTLRCISNHSVDLNDKSGCYQYQIDPKYQTPVEYLPVPSIWTPQHALMNVAPCISSPGFYQRQNSTQKFSCGNKSGVYSEVMGQYSSTDSEEENAIY